MLIGDADEEDLDANAEEDGDLPDDSMDDLFVKYCKHLTNPQKFSRVVGVDVPLSKLYKMVNTCVHNEGN